jgi:hypothetical protein
MKIYSLKRIAVPKLAVLVTGLATALAVGAIAPTPAQAKPGYAQDCSGCHSKSGSITATPSTATPALGATYTVKLSTGVDGYWITGNGASVAGSSATSVSMKAPAAAGTYTYTVYVRNGGAASTTYKITVGQVTPPPTTVPPTTVPPTTVPPTTVPPTTVPATTVPATTVPATTVPPTTVPPTTVPATTVPPTARISRLSPNDGESRDRVTITGSGLGRAGVVKFGTVTATVSSWSTTRITVRVPREGRSSRVSVTVTPANGTASNARTFRYDNHDND